MENEFNTNLASKEERIKVRQRRVEARNASEDRELGKKMESQEESSRSRGQQQVANSRAHLDKKKYGGIENVTNVRVACDRRESLRRVAEETHRHERLQRLQEEAVASGKQNAAVELRWSELLDQTMPQELHEEIEAQKSACAEIIASKDGIIREFQLQLKAKDEEYVKALKQQASDIEELLQRMRQEFRELREEYEVELDAIEDAFLSERDEILSANRAEIDALFEKRREMELLYMDRKREREEQYQQEIEDLLVRDAEEYNKLKIKLETDIQTLEQQLEEMRATYQLNTEKLEYNYRVLTERDNENSTTLAQLKRKQTKLKDALGAVVAKYHETDARDRKKNDELTEEYRRITKQYRDLQAKFRHFQVADNERFDQVWAMHEEEVNDLVAKVLKADRIIHQQQLGWDWRPPDVRALLRTTTDLVPVANDNKEPEETDTRSASTKVVGKLPGDDSETQQPRDDDDDDERPKRETTIPSFKLKAMLELLSSEAGFLVEPKVREAIESLGPEEAELARAESMLRALGARDDSDVAALVAKFFVEPPKKRADDLDDLDDDDLKEDDDDLKEDDGEDGALKQLQNLISPDDVIKAIREFVEESKRAKGTRASASVSDPTRLGTVADETRRAEEREFWHRLADVVGDKTFQVWEQLETTVGKYNDILTHRAAEIDKVKHLQDQNAQLKALLGQYLSAKVNDDLIVPPAKMIRLPASSSS